MTNDPSKLPWPDNIICLWTFDTNCEWTDELFGNNWANEGIIHPYTDRWACHEQRYDERQMHKRNLE